MYEKVKAETSFKHKFSTRGIQRVRRKYNPKIVEYLQFLFFAELLNIKLHVEYSQNLTCSMFILYFQCTFFESLSLSYCTYYCIRLIRTYLHGNWRYSLRSYLNKQVFILFPRDVVNRSNKLSHFGDLLYPRKYFRDPV